METLKIFHFSFLHFSFRCSAVQLYKPFEELSKNIGDAPINAPINVPIKKLSENEKRIILLILEDEKITIKELAKKTGMNERTIKRNIEKLKNKSILKREGSRKSGYWKIIKR